MVFNKYQVGKQCYLDVPISRGFTGIQPRNPVNATNANVLLVKNNIYHPVVIRPVLKVQ